MIYISGWLGEEKEVSTSLRQLENRRRSRSYDGGSSAVLTFRRADGSSQVQADCRLGALIKSWGCPILARDSCQISPLPPSNFEQGWGR